MAKKLKRMREGGERIYPNPPTFEDLQKLYNAEHFLNVSLGKKKPAQLNDLA